MKIFLKHSSSTLIEPAENYIALRRATASTKITEDTTIQNTAADNNHVTCETTALESDKTSSIVPSLNTIGKLISGSGVLTTPAVQIHPPSPSPAHRVPPTAAHPHLQHNRFGSPDFVIPCIPEQHYNSHNLLLSTSPKRHISTYGKCQMILLTTM